LIQKSSFFSSIACIIALTFVREYPFSAFSACVIFLSLLPAPYYFYKKSKDMENFLFKRNRDLKLKYQTTLSKYRKAFYKRQKQEDNIDKVIKFYGMWKNLYMNISKDEYAEVILTVKLVLKVRRFLRKHNQAGLS
jgi:hypothetical protein